MFTASHRSKGNRIQLDVVEFAVLIHLLKKLTDLIEESEVTPCSAAKLNHPLTGGVRVLS